MSNALVHTDHPLRHWDHTCPACNRKKYEWKGDGDEPPRWTADDGTVVYRSLSDFRNDQLEIETVELKRST